MDDPQDVETLSEKLISYLRAELGNAQLEYAAPPARLPGGNETWTYRFLLNAASDAWSGPLVLRLYPRFYGTGNAVWESTVQNVLAGEGYPVPRAHLVCTDMSVLGGAFYVMDHLPGSSLGAAPLESVPRLLGETHASLHEIDPDPLIVALRERGIAERRCQLARRLDSLRERAEGLPWVRPAVDWLLANRPPEPDQPAVCHGDFHPFNILYAGGQVTGVLDWPGFAIADPAYDVGTTLVLVTIPSKHLSTSTEGLSSVDWERMADLYLAAYRARRSLDGSNLPYYRVRRCVAALIEGAGGQQVWQHPAIVQDLVAYTCDVTGIEIDACASP
jgi:aminoglycoside phosphotransferase (APT) family kinase protein